MPAGEQQQQEGELAPAATPRSAGSPSGRALPGGSPPRRAGRARSRRPCRRRRRRSARRSAPARRSLRRPTAAAASRPASRSTRAASRGQVLQMGARRDLRHHAAEGRVLRFLAQHRLGEDGAVRRPHHGGGGLVAARFQPQHRAAVGPVHARPFRLLAAGPMNRACRPRRATRGTVRPARNAGTREAAAPRRGGGAGA